jgi:hypothetical protein
LEEALEIVPLPVVALSFQCAQILERVEIVEVLTIFLEGLPLFTEDCRERLRHPAPAVLQGSREAFENDRYGIGPQWRIERALAVLVLSEGDEEVLLMLTEEMVLGFCPAQEVSEGHLMALRFVRCKILRKERLVFYGDRTKMREELIIHETYGSMFCVHLL